MLRHWTDCKACKVGKVSTKKYFWLKQPSTFFQDPKIKKLRRIAGGDTYTIIYQKIMLLSIVNGGVIKYEHIEDSLAKELSLILDEDEDNVKVTLAFMQSQGLIEELNSEEFLLPSVPALIGMETDSAERMRRLRDKKENQKIELKDKKASHCDGDVRSCYTEIELEKENNIPAKTLQDEELLNKFNLIWREYSINFLKAKFNRRGGSKDKAKKNFLGLVAKGYLIDDIVSLIRSEHGLDYPRDLERVLHSSSMKQFIEDREVQSA